MMMSTSTEVPSSLESVRESLKNRGNLDAAVGRPVPIKAESREDLSSSYALIRRGYYCSHCRSNRTPTSQPAFAIKDLYIFCHNCGSATWPPEIIQHIFGR